MAGAGANAAAYIADDLLMRSLDDWETGRPLRRERALCRRERRGRLDVCCFASAFESGQSPIVLFRTRCHLAKCTPTGTCAGFARIRLARRGRCTALIYLDAVASMFGSGGCSRLPLASASRALVDCLGGHGPSCSTGGSGILVRRTQEVFARGLRTSRAAFDLYDKK